MLLIHFFFLFLIGISVYVDSSSTCLNISYMLFTILAFLVTKRTLGVAVRLLMCSSAMMDLLGLCVLGSNEDLHLLSPTKSLSVSDLLCLLTILGKLTVLYDSLS